METYIKPFRVGVVINGCRARTAPKRTVNSVCIDYPSRLEAMALDPSQLVNNAKHTYPAGQIDVTVPLFKRVTVTVTPGKAIRISPRTPRQSLVRHAALLMRAALNVDEGLLIDIQDNVNLRHCGLGSSSSLIASTASALNELYGHPIAPLDLARYCAQNHGEEIDGDIEHLMPVQCIGGSAVCGNFVGGLIVLAGEATPIAQVNIPARYHVVIGVPRDFTHPDSRQLMQAEADNMDGFVATGELYAKDVAHRLVHRVLPALKTGDLKPAGELIFDYRWNMGSIKNCSFVFHRMLDIADNLRDYYLTGGCDILALSSVGPGFFAVTDRPHETVARFEANNMRTITTRPHNGRYIVVHNADTKEHS